jgi:hypothetical protein
LDFGQTQLRLANIFVVFFVDWGRKIGGVFFVGNGAQKLKGMGRTIIFTMQKVKQE